MLRSLLRFTFFNIAVGIRPPTFGIYVSLWYYHDLLTSRVYFTTFTFYNRYIEEHVQRTGVAIETQGFSLVTSGRKRESLTVSEPYAVIKIHISL